MLIVNLIALILFSSTSFAGESDCNNLVPLDKVKEICGVEFIKDKTSTRKSSCKTNYINKAMGKKYVGDVGISSELVIKTNNRINKKGKVMAPISYKTGLEGVKTRGIFKKEIKDLGEGGYYTEQNIHQTVTWYKGNYLYNFTVDKGKKNGGEWVAPCTPDQTIQIAKLIK